MDQERKNKKFVSYKEGAYMRKDSLADDIDYVYDLFPRLKERS